MNTRSPAADAAGLCTDGSIGSEKKDAGVLEAAALTAFWQSVNPTPDPSLRLARLQEMGTIVIPRPAEWNYDELRQTRSLGSQNLIADKCFVCLNGDRDWQWHHVIWIRHGGSHTPRNYVRLCVICHEHVHGHDVKPERSHRRDQWFQIGEIGERLIALHDRRRR